MDLRTFMRLTTNNQSPWRTTKPLFYKFSEKKERRYCSKIESAEQLIAQKFIAQKRQNFDYLSKLLSNEKLSKKQFLSHLSLYFVQKEYKTKQCDRRKPRKFGQCRNFCPPKFFVCRIFCTIRYILLTTPASSNPRM